MCIIWKALCPYVLDARLGLWVSLGTRLYLCTYNQPSWATLCVLCSCVCVCVDCRERWLLDITWSVCYVTVCVRVCWLQGTLVVGHNMILDVLHLIEHFITPLPHVNVSLWFILLHIMFNMLDNKHLMSNLANCDWNLTTSYRRAVKLSAGSVYYRRAVQLSAGSVYYRRAVKLSAGSVYYRCAVAVLQDYQEFKELMKCVLPRFVCCFSPARCLANSRIRT